jgi:hypothetical protein
MSIGRTMVQTAIRIDCEQAVVAFANLQVFALIYLQKFVVGGESFPLSVPMLVMFASIAWMVVTERLSFVATRLATYMIFVCSCLLSCSLTGGSITSILQLILLYASMTVCATVSEAAYRQVLDRFAALMILPAWLIVMQYVYQKVTGGSDPVSMTPLVPKWLLMQGYFYEAHLPWDAPFMRPNGFFFLEPSFASIFTASAAILEINYSRRLRRIILMLAATYMSTGATGVFMLLIAAPLLLARESPGVVAAVLTAITIGTVVALVSNVPLPLMSRVDEINDGNASGGSHVVLPASQFVALLSDPSYLLIGNGAGSSARPPASATIETVGTNSPIVIPWPMVKLTNEYGILSIVAFIVFYITGIGDRTNLPLKIALSVVYFFSGGYLLSPTIVEMLVILCFVVRPERTKDMNTFPASTRP